MADPDLSHGILGRWAVVGRGCNIGSISASAVVIAAFACACIRSPYLYWRPSFRLAAWIAVCDTVYSVCQLCVLNNEYMSGLSEMNLRVVHWLMNASILSFAFLSACVGVQLVLTVLTANIQIARCIQPWYEVASLFLGYAITHPFLYLYDSVTWGSTAQVFQIYDNPTHYMVSSWLTMWAWMLAACSFLAVVGMLVFVKMATVFPKHLHPNIFPEGNDNDDSDAPGLTGNALPISNERSQKIRSVTVRMLFYSLVPIVTQAWVLAANMLTHCPMWLYVLANLIPATQGMINLLVFTTNPAWDDYRHWLVNRYGRLRAKGHGVAKIGCAGNTHGLETEAPRSPTLLDK